MKVLRNHSQLSLQGVLRLGILNQPMNPPKVVLLISLSVGKCNQRARVKFIGGHGRQGLRERRAPCGSGVLI